MYEEKRKFINKWRLMSELKLECKLSLQNCNEYFMTYIEK